MLRALSSTEYGEMVEWWNSEPRDEKRGDYQAAAISAWSLAPHTKQHRPPPLSDVMLKFDSKPAKPQSVEEQMQVCQGIQNAMRRRHGGR